MCVGGVGWGGGVVSYTMRDRGSGNINAGTDIDIDIDIDIDMCDM